MKYFFYILGIFCFTFAPAELIPASVGLIVIGMIFHLNDIKEEILKRIDEMENNLKTDHRYIKDLVNKK